MKVRAETLLEIVRRILEALGASPADAATVAAHLVGANLCGHDSHGIIRLRQYRDHVREGKIDPRAAPKVIREGAGTALMDGSLAWGQVVATRAMEVAIEKARRTGAAAVGVRNSYHVGRVGVYPLLAAREGFIAQVLCNGHGIARVAPWGGTEPRLATNPLAVAIPAGAGAEPVLVDITTSVVAEGKVRLAKQAGRPIPEGWVLDAEGRPSTDPAALYLGGSLLPLGGREGHKGYALSVVVDLLAGILSGAGAGLLTKSVGNGLFIQVTDPEAFMDRAELEARVKEFTDYLRSSKTKPGVAEILLPGEPEVRMEALRRKEGIELEPAAWQEVLEIAKELGVEAGPM